MPKRTNASLRIIADRVGVSVPTVSRVLSGKANQFRISKKTEEAINSVAEELQYTPNRLASSLRLKRTHTLGLIIPDISNPFFASTARSVENAARQLGYSIILSDTQENTKLEVQSLSLLQSRMVDGLIICPVGQDGSHIQPFIDARIPIVFLDRYFPDIKCPFVVSDNYKGALEAVSHIISRGHTSVACIQGLHDTSPNRDRVQGYKDALLQHSLPVQDSFILGSDFGEENGYIQTKILLKLPQRPTAIFALGNLIALGALRALSEENLHVPDDISIVSFDDQPYFNFLSTPMTTVAQQSKEMGRIAVKLLIEEIEAPHRSENVAIKLPTPLIVRNSVKRINPQMTVVKKLGTP